MGEISKESSGLDVVQIDKALKAIVRFTDERCDTIMAMSVERRLRRLNAVVAEAAATPADGRFVAKLTPHEFLSRSLPSVDPHPLAATPSSAGREHPYLPDVLEEWSAYNGSDPMVLVQQFQQNADRNTYSIYPVAENQAASVNSESGVNQLLFSGLITPLHQANLTPGSWEYQPPNHIIQEATAYYEMVAASSQDLVTQSRPRPAAAATAAPAVHGLLVPAHHRALGSEPTLAATAPLPPAAAAPMNQGPQAASVPVLTRTAAAAAAGPAVVAVLNHRGVAPATRQAVVSGQDSAAAAAAATTNEKDKKDEQEERVAEVAAEVAAAHQLPSSGKRKYKQDIMVFKPGPAYQPAIMVFKPGPAYQPAIMVFEPGPAYQPATKRRCYMVGELKTPARLSSEGQPVLNLVECYYNHSHALHTEVVAVIAQIFTYMLSWRLCFGFISTYMATWLLYCPPNQRRRLYITCGVRSTDTSPAATSRGAIAWLQSEAWQRRNVAVLAYPVGDDTAVGESSSSGGNGSSSGGEAPDDSNYHPSTQPSEDSNRLSTDQSQYNQQHSQQHSRQHSQQHNHMQKPRLQLDKLLCEGSEGYVYQGSYSGTKAVFKLLGPARSPPNALRKEVAAYEALAPMQGKLLPTLLSTGSFKTGVWYIAVSFVEGTPLSQMDVISLEVAQAAVNALECLHIEGNKGFLHGDIRLANVIYLESSKKCNIIDFGRSKIGASHVQQAAEKQQLATLVGLAG